MPWRRGQWSSQDLRDRVLSAVDAGTPVYPVAKSFAESVSYIYKALSRRRTTGDSGANPNRGHRPRKLTPAQEPALAARIAAAPDITLARLQDWLLAEHAVRLSNGAMWAAVQRLGLSFKKRLRAAGQNRPDVAARRFVDPERLVFIDETGANTKMTRLYGRAPKGERLKAKAPFGHWKTMTFVAALRCSDVGVGVTAPWVLDGPPGGPMDGEAFRTWVRHVLAPTLEPGDIVVMDNPPAHKVAGIRQDHRHTLATDRKPSRRFQTKRVRQLLPSRRISTPIVKML